MAESSHGLQLIFVTASVSSRSDGFTDHVSAVEVAKIAARAHPVRYGPVCLAPAAAKPIPCPLPTPTAALVEICGGFRTPSAANHAQPEPSRRSRRCLRRSFLRPEGADLEHRSSHESGPQSLSAPVFRGRSLRPCSASASTMARRRRLSSAWLLWRLRVARLPATPQKT